MVKGALNRRKLFSLGAALASAPTGFAAASTGLPRSIIYMVSDGMSSGVIPMAERFSQIVRGRGTVWHNLLQRQGVTHGLLDMASLNSLVTDSSAASSSWGSGSRIFNAMVNVLPDGTRLTPIGWLAADKGKKIGLVTTATVTHATPAGFCAVSPRRDDEDLIATQYLGKADVILGGGRKFFTAAKRKDGRDLFAAYREMGYQISSTASDLKSGASSKLLGLYGESHLPYTIDQRADEKLRQSVPTLAAMTVAALASLDSSSNGFLLQVEGARVDHAAHANDAAAQLWDQIAFDDAIRVVLDYAEKRPDTLVIITSDHGNSNPGIFGVGREYAQSTQSFERLAKAHCSYSALAARFGTTIEYQGLASAAAPKRHAPSVDVVRDTVRQTMSIDLNEREGRALHNAIKREPRLSCNEQLDNLAGVLGQVLGNHTGVGWIGTTHSSDYTMLTALGPGSGQFAGLIRNTEVFGKLTRLMEIDFKNPAMDEEKAVQFSASAPKRERFDWA